MKNKKVITIVLAAMLACTAVTACGKKEATDEFEKTVEVETDVVAETEEPEVIESEVAAEPEVNDPTYCNLMSDPNFDMENAVRDDWQSDFVKENISKQNYDVLFNYVDGKRYAEITGATVTELNKTITFEVSDAKFFPHLAYYGVDPNPSVCGAMQMFALIDTSLEDMSYTESINCNNPVTVLKTYTIPEDTMHNNGWRVLTGVGQMTDSKEDMLCEVEYNGKQGYMVLSDWDLGLRTPEE